MKSKTRQLTLPPPPLPPVFDIYAIELLGSISTDEAWLHLLTLHFYPEYIDRQGVYQSL